MLLRVTESLPRNFREKFYQINKVIVNEVYWAVKCSEKLWQTLKGTEFFRILAQYVLIPCLEYV